MDLERLAEELAGMPGVVAVALGGSRAQGNERPGSDWDLGLYYRGMLDVGAIRRLDYGGEVAEPGRWGRLMNGGAWLLIEGERVDLLFRDLDVVEHWTREAERGHFEIDAVPGYLVGMPTYVLAGELAVARVLHGELPRPEFPAELRESAPRWWHGRAAFSLVYADTYAARGQPLECAGSLAAAVLATAWARLAERGVWAFNDKRLVQLAGLADVVPAFSALGASAEQLGRAVDEVRSALAIARPAGLKLDTAGG